MSIYATKKKLYHATGVDTFTLFVKKNFIALKDEINKLDINKLVNVPTTLINFKTNTEDIDIGKLKNVPVDLKKINDVVDNEAVKNTKFNTLKTKVNSLEKKPPYAAIVIHINQCNIEKQDLE